MTYLIETIFLISYLFDFQYPNIGDICTAYAKLHFHCATCITITRTEVEYITVFFF